MEDLTGKTLGKYEVVGVLGRGGMAVVYRARDPSIGRFVALKVLPRNYASDPEFIGRFTQEARVIAQLDHPHILPVYDFGSEGGFTYMVMPLMERGTLGSRLAGRPLELAEMKRIVRQLASALDYAHGKGVVHRDLKPANVLIDESDNCRLTDFGIAKLIEATTSFTMTGGIMGTPLYMSPEQALGEPADARSDVYSLGVILYELSTGRVPFLGKTPVAVTMAHVSQAPPSPRGLNATLGEDVERVIVRALAKSPDDRYSTAGELGRVLGEALELSLESPAPPVPPPVSPATDSEPLLEDLETVLPPRNEAREREEAKRARDEEQRVERERAEREVREEEQRAAAERAEGEQAEARARAARQKDEARARAAREKEQAREKQARELEQRRRLEAEEAERRRVEAAELEKKKAAQAAERAEEAAQRAEQERKRKAAKELERREADERKHRERAEKERKRAVEKARKARERAKRPPPNWALRFKLVAATLVFVGAGWWLASSGWLDPEFRRLRGVEREVTQLVEAATKAEQAEDFAAAIEALESAKALLDADELDAARATELGARVASLVRDRDLLVQRERERRETAERQQRERQLADQERAAQEAQRIREARLATEAAQQQVDGLLERGRQALDAGRLVRPQGTSAVVAYREVLDLSPADSRAREGLLEVRGAVFDVVDRAEAEQRLDFAVDELTAAAQAFPEDAEAFEQRLAALRVRIAAEAEARAVTAAAERERRVLQAAEAERRRNETAARARREEAATRVRREAAEARRLAEEAAAARPAPTPPPQEPVEPPPEPRRPRRPPVGF